jgi:hypothetical protein
VQAVKRLGGAMEIIRQVQELIWWVVKQALQFIAFVLAAVLAPIILTVLPAVMIYQNPNVQYVWLEQIFFLTAPLSCAFYMVISTHWHSVRLWQREGRDLGVMGSKWREAHGGMFCTVLKSTVYMFGALFASYFFEVLYLYAFQYVPLTGTVKVLAYFELFPLAAYAPVILLWVTRWLRGSEA